MQERIDMVCTTIRDTGTAVDLPEVLLAALHMSVRFKLKARDLA